MLPTTPEAPVAGIGPSHILARFTRAVRTVKLSEIHREMGFSRQAAQQAIDRLVGHDMIAVTRDPGSKRDKMVSITEKGQRWRTIAADQIRQIETDIAEAIGEDSKEALRGYLTSLVKSMGVLFR